MMAIHRNAAVKYARVRRVTVAPVEIVVVPREVVKLAHAIARCACQVKLRGDGSALVVNQCQHETRG
jgi:hypothetical protein